MNRTISSTDFSFVVWFRSWFVYDIFADIHVKCNSIITVQSKITDNNSRNQKQNIHFEIVLIETAKIKGLKPFSVRFISFEKVDFIFSFNFYLSQCVNISHHNQIMELQCLFLIFEHLLFFGLKPEKEINCYEKRR